jgi:NAD(P)-dependent dehydrogenase (short-subunit alcohol dehydrogenase family)
VGAQRCDRERRRTGIHPHPVNAERLDGAEFAENVIARLPVGRNGTTTDVAAAVLFLASPAASFVNGTNILTDGGWTAQ